MAHLSDCVTFVMTDVEGSTALWEADPALASKVIARQEQLIVTLVRNRGGEVIKPRGEGDSTFSAFRSAKEALTAAQEIQQAIVGEPWAGSDAPRVRIAIHSGPAEIRDGDYFGSVLNRCARIRSAAHGGQIVLSDAVRRKGSDLMHFRDLGRHRLKDLLSPEHLFELVWSDREFPPLRSLNGLDHNLPVQLTSFVGREKDLASLEAALEKSRLVTLTGFGGAGKTRIGLQMAAQRLESADQMVRFVALSGLPVDSDVTPSVARALGVGMMDGSDHMAKLADELRDRTCLLFLDNCEHVLDSTSRLAKALLTECPDLQILTTSRQPLDLSGERCLLIGPLSTPPEGRDRPIEVLKSEAAALFLDRVRLKNPDFALDAGSSPLVAKLVRDLEGVPLAIEQAAARAATLGLGDVVERLRHKLELLSSTDRDLEPRQRTVRATIEWSHELLGPSERELFARLGAFQGVFTLADAAVAAGRDVVSDLESLAHKSMVAQVHLSSHEMGYRLLDTVKEFARERIERDLACAYDGHLQWCLETASWIDEKLEGPQSSEAFHLLDRVYEDLISGLRRAIDTRDERALRLAFALRKPWLRRGPTVEGVRLMSVVIDSVQTEDAYLAADCHNALGALAMTSGMNELAQEHLQRAADDFQRLDRPTKVAAAMTNIGILLSIRGEFEDGKPYFERAIAAFQKAGDHSGAAKTALNLGRMLLDAGKPADAAGHLEQALGFFESKDPLNEALSLINLAESASSREPSSGLRFLSRAFRIMREAPDHAQISVALSQLSRYAMSIGRLDEAAILLGAAEACMVELTAESSRHVEIQWQDLEGQLRDKLPADRYQRLFSKGRAFDLVSRATYASELCDAFQ